MNAVENAPTGAVSESIIIDLNNQQLPGIQPPTPEEIAKAKAAADALVEATKAAGIVRFESTFKLQGEVVGEVKRKVSKKGAVTLSVLPLKSKDGKSMASESAASNGGVAMKGEVLAAFARLRTDGFKTEEIAQVSRLGGDANWTGLAVKNNAANNEVWFGFKRVEPVKVSVTGAPSDESIAKAMGWTVDQVKATRIANELKAAADKTAKEQAAKDEVAKAAQAIADEEAQKELEREAAEIQKSAERNGEVDDIKHAE